MKIVVLSDIHGNLPALEHVSADFEPWEPDMVIVNGDIVNRGPESLACWQFVQQKAKTDNWVLLRGNHEEYVIDCSSPDFPREGPEFELMQFAFWSYQQLHEDVDGLAALREQFEWIAPDGTALRVTHASMHSNRDGLYPQTPDDKMRAQIAPAPAVFVTSHTHRPFIRHIDDTIIANIGSVGAPFDEDLRPSYGRFVWTANKGWQAEIARVAYDLKLIEKAYVTSGFLSEAGPLAQIMLAEIRKGRGLIYRWASKYQEDILAGRLTIADSVRHILCEDDVRPFTGPPGWTIS